ncbi:MAG: hypothetical protein V2A54_02995 [Bacteroidota bacterium]
MSFFAMHTSKIILLLAAILLTSGCNLNFNPMRYPDLRKIPVNAQRANDSNHMLQAQKMRMLHSVKLVERAEEIVWMNPLSIVMKSNTASHSGVFQKIENKTLSLKNKLSVASRLRKMIEKQNKPADAMFIIIAILLIFVIGAIIAVIKITDPTGGMGCLLWGIFILVVLGLLFGVVLSSK